MISQDLAANPDSRNPSEDAIAISPNFLKHAKEQTPKSLLDADQASHSSYKWTTKAMEIAMSSASQILGKTKHIEIWYHFVRDAYQ
jgi:hypothetical protein